MVRVQTLVKALCLSCCCICGYAAGKAALTLLPSDTLGRCMDGSPGGYYLQTARSTERKRCWTMSLQGGGSCASEQNCKQRMPSHGTSAHFGSMKTLGHANLLLSDSPDINSLFWGCNHVYVPYCSQDFHMGTRTEATADTWNIYFSGHHIFEAILAELDQKGLVEATEIVLTGQSAGGIGSWTKFDYLAERYPKATVTGSPLAGFYFYAYPYTGPGHADIHPPDFQPQFWEHHYNVWQAKVDQSCAAALHQTPWACLLANNSWPYVETRVFMVQSQTDALVLQWHDAIPDDQWWSWWSNLTNPHQAEERAYVLEWQQNMSAALMNTVQANSSRFGFFAAACYTHTDFSHIQIQGMSYAQAFSNWYRHQLQGSFVADDCGLVCNPTCPFMGPPQSLIIVLSVLGGLLLLSIAWCFRDRLKRVGKRLCHKCKLQRSRYSALSRRSLSESDMSLPAAMEETGVDLPHSSTARHDRFEAVAQQPQQQMLVPTWESLAMH